MRGNVKSYEDGWGIFSYMPELHIAFCLIFVHPLFPMFEPHIQKWSFLSVVALVSVTLLDSNPRTPEKRSNLVPTPSSSLARTMTIDLPECQERHRAKTIESVFLRRRRRRPPWGFQPFLLNIAGRRPAMFRERPAEGPQVGF